MKTKMITLAVILSVLIMLAFQGTLRAQNNNHPPSIKWRRITTEHFNIIYSEDIESEAQRVANMSEHYLGYHLKTLSPDWRKTTIVLASEAAESNGGVFYSPFMAEYYNSPSTFSASEWYATLSVHEIRHMVQLNTVNSEGRKIFWYVFGDNGAAAYAILFVPSWFLEGDAVLAETSLTDGGRGRVPVFDLWQRTNELSNGPTRRYNYYRAYLGAPHDNYPYANYYVLGYHMVTYGRRNYGPQLWDNTLHGMGERLSPLTYFDSSFKRNNADKLNTDDLYHATYNDLRKRWQAQIEALELTESQPVIAADDRYWSGYLSLQESNGKLYALQMGKGIATEIVEFENGKRKRRVRKIPISLALGSASSNERAISIGAGKAVWVEMLPDARWGKRTYSSIVICDLQSGASRRLFPKGKYLYAAISKDGGKIAAVEFNERRQCSLVIIDAQKGTELQRVAAQEGDFFYDPAWNDDATSLALCALSEKGSSMYLVNAATGKMTALIAHGTKEHPKTPFISRETVFYGSDYSGIDNIYALNLKDGTRYQVTSRKYGAYFPSVSESGETLYYSDYSVKGYSGESMPLQRNKWLPVEKVAVDRIDYFEPVIAQEAGRSVASEVPGREYESKKYTPFFNSLNIYSWMPMILPDYGLILYSEDHLHTTSAALAYNYNMNEKAHSVLGDINYSGLYPVLGIGGIYGDRVKVNDEGDRIKWREKSAFAMVSLPFELSRGTHTTALNFSLTGALTEISDKSLFEKSLSTIDEGNLTTLSWNTSAYHQVEGSLLDLYPRWGQQLYVNYAHTPSGDYSAQQFALAAALYFPSVFRHHSLFFSGGYEYDEKADYRYEMKFLFPRGYNEKYFENFYKASANYAFPLFDADMPVWKLLYIKRFSAELFYDYGRGEYDDEYYLRRSAGAELIAKFNIFTNANLVLESGAGRMYCFDSESFEWEFVFRFSNSQ